MKTACLKLKSGIVLPFLVTFSIIGCEPSAHKVVSNNGDSESVTEGAVSLAFDKVNQQIFQAACVSCHSGSIPAGGVDLSSYAAVMSSGTVVIGDAASSVLYQEVYRGDMPASGALSENLTELLGRWIDEGARETASGPVNYPPVVEVTGDQQIQWPVDSVEISALVSDSDGSIASLQWSQISGPGTASIQGETSPVLRVQNLRVGVYVFQLEVEDDFGDRSTDQVTVTVQP